MEVITEMFRAFETLLLAFLLALPRCYAFIAASQLLAPTAVPRLARNVAILVIAMPMTPALIPFTPLFSDNISLFIGYFFKEAALGILMGFLVLWQFWSIQSAGTFIDNQRGAAIASSIDPLQGHESSPLGTLFSQAFITYFFAVGGFLMLIDLLYLSYREWPIINTIPIVLEAFPEMMLELLDKGMRLMFILSAPVVAIMFFAEFALALVSRFAPQIQVFILAMPIKSGIAMFILVFYIPLMLRYSVEQDGDLIRIFDRFYEMLRVGAEVITP